MTHRIETGKNPPQSNTAFIGIGSNIGDRLAFCRKAVAALKTHPAVRTTHISSLYESDPVDFLKQGRFFNAVAALETCLSPQDLLRHCQKIEAGLDKKIDIPKGPRTIDLDLLFYNDLVMTSPNLTLPHPEAAHRAFVLIPLLEIAPDFVHIQYTQSIATLLARLEPGNKTQIEKRFLPGWEIEP